MGLSSLARCPVVLKITKSINGKKDTLGGEGVEDVSRKERVWTGLYLSLPLIKTRESAVDWDVPWREATASVKGDDALQPFRLSPPPPAHGGAFLRCGNLQ